ncbi:hypothetical protein KQX54_012230 [Cotesia glomerata]|uniref:Uncharacterized protein n=1 Tax=Cotesia glomerata TaxID=32391 RepID=A0AAV7J2N1_COTGL|nr:hypothetical protein KQX54_012230 [Cotesia glomerata]
MASPWKSNCKNCIISMEILHQFLLKLYNCAKHVTFNKDLAGCLKEVDEYFAYELGLALRAFPFNKNRCNEAKEYNRLTFRAIFAADYLLSLFYMYGEKLYLPDLHRAFKLDHGE